MLRTWEMKKDGSDIKLFLTCDRGMRNRTMGILDESIEQNQSLLFNTIPLVMVGKTYHHQMTKTLAEAFTLIRVDSYEIHPNRDGTFDIVVKGILHTSGMDIDPYNSTRKHI